MLDMSLLQIAGLVGFLSYINTFIWLQNGRLRGDSIQYSALSIFSASLVLISLTENFNISSVLIQISWISIGFYGVLRHLQKNNPLRRFLRNGSRVAGLGTILFCSFLAMSSATSNGDMALSNTGQILENYDGKSDRLCLSEHRFGRLNCAASGVWAP